MEGLKSVSGETLPNKIWENVFGNATQPLFIWNDGSAKSYGYIGSSVSTSSEYNLASMRIKTGGGAKASVYLVDMDDETRQSMLSVSRSLTYWYDDDGNVCTGDPSKNSSTIAFKLQKNGLYKANKNWDGYEKLGDMKEIGRAHV